MEINEGSSDWYLIRQKARVEFEATVVVYDSKGLVRNHGSKGVVGLGGMGLQVDNLNLEFGQEVTIEFLNEAGASKCFARANVVNFDQGEQVHTVGFEFLALNSEATEMITQMLIEG